MNRNNNIDEIEPYGHGNKLVQLWLYEIRFDYVDPYDIPLVPPTAM